MSTTTPRYGFGTPPIDRGGSNSDPVAAALARYASESEKLEKEFRDRLSQLRLKVEMELHVTLNKGQSSALTAPPVPAAADGNDEFSELPAMPLSRPSSFRSSAPNGPEPPFSAPARRSGGGRSGGKSRRRSSIMISDDLSLRWKSMHELCCDPGMTMEALETYMEKYSANDDVETEDENGSCPIHLLFANASLTEAMCSTYLDKFGWTCEMMDASERSVLSLLCGNPCISLAKLTKLINVARECEALEELLNTASQTGAMPLHYLCANSYVSVETLRLMVATAPKSVDTKDGKGRTPQTILTANRSHTRAMIAALNGGGARTGKVCLHLRALRLYICLNLCTY